MSRQSTSDDTLRTSRLHKLFQSTVRGERSLKNSQDGHRFIEALCVQADPATCLETIMSSSSGISAIQTSVTFSLSTAFFNGPAADLLTYLQCPALESLLEGAFLEKVLTAIVDPPIFWTALVQCYRNDELEVRAKLCFGWLLVRLMYLPLPRSTRYHELARDPTIQRPFLDSSDFNLRTIGSKIKHILSAFDSPSPEKINGTAGGRHDNDFADFRQIAILPTADELLSREFPFLRFPDYLDDPELDEHRLALHLDNQFRLNRADMIGELREELQIVLGEKKGRHRGIIIDGLRVLDIDCGNESKRQSWGLQLQCMNDLAHLRGANPKDRKALVEKNYHLLKHQSLTCLVLDGAVVAFPSIHRDADLLSAQPPIISVKFTGIDQSSITKSLLKLKTCKSIKLVQIDTAVFAREPILRRLQEMKGLPLVEEILLWGPEAIIGQTSKAPLHIIDRIKKNPSQDLQEMLQHSKSLVLDHSQSQSLVAALQQNVSLIQGPPGSHQSSNK